MKNGDYIIIKDLEVYAFHGVNEEEKQLGQKFILTLNISADLKEAAAKDDILKTINYAQLCSEVEAEFKRNKYNLIETAGGKLAEFILTKYNFANEIEVTVKKPWAPIGSSLSYAAIKIRRSWHDVFIGIGSNIGDKSGNIKRSIEIINSSKYCRVIKVSDTYETKPVGYAEQDNFLNCAAKIKTMLSPLELVKFLMKIEKDLKRERKVKWGPRTIDLDVLLYDDIISSDESIIIPHPRMHERLFVLKPLCDIAPYVVHPILKKRIFEIEKEVSKTQKLL